MSQIKFCIVMLLPQWWSESLNEVTRAMPKFEEWMIKVVKNKNEQDGECMLYVTLRHV